MKLWGTLSIAGDYRRDNLCHKKLHTRLWLEVLQTMSRHPLGTAVGGSLALCALLEIAPAIAAPDEGTEPDHLVILELGASGWFLEPSYAIALGNGNGKSVGLTGGIFFALP